MFREMARLNPVIFWCSDEQKLEWLFNFGVFKPGKEGEIDCLISAYFNFQCYRGNVSESVL